jgi:Uma2 family endonuclease
MAAPTITSALGTPTLPPILDDIPILYEDEEEGDMGESNPHSDAGEILHVCLKAHLPRAAGYRVFFDMNLYYRNGPRHPKTHSLPYVSPDVMVVTPFTDLGEEVSSYTIGKDGPSPLLVTEVLSRRSAQQRDKEEKLDVYRKLSIPEYVLLDSSGRFLRERMLLKRLQDDRTWKDEQDSDGGVTSRLGFRLIWDTDGRLRVLDAATGRRYPRPDEAQAEADALQRANERILALEAELARLKGAPRKPSPKRRKKP